MKYKFLNMVALVGVASILLSSCIKDDYEELTNQGNSFVKILEAPEKQLFFSPFTDVKVVDLFSLRKDAATNSSLNTASTIKLTMSPALIDTFNSHNGTDFEVLPDSLYTLVDPTIKTSATEYSFALPAGQFAKDFSINLNGAKWDLSHRYAMAFTVTDSSGLDITEGKKEIIAFLSVKNKWDGVYEVTGTFSDATNPAFTGLYPYTWELQTTGPSQVIVVDNKDLGFPGFIFETGAGASYYGNFGLVINFNPDTDEIESITNYYGQPASNTRSAELDPTGINAYDAATKTINIKYFMKQPSVVPVAPNIRAMFNESWKYVKER